jgi:DNA-binding transcriptional ArsR family regulator
MFIPSQRHELPDHFLALANPTRLRILERLGAVGEESVNDLAVHLRMSQPRISWHLRMLRVENIARERARLDQLLGIKDRLNVREEVRA